MIPLTTKDGATVASSSPAPLPSSAAAPPVSFAAAAERPPATLAPSSSPPVSFAAAAAKRPPAAPASAPPEVAKPHLLYIDALNIDFGLKVQPGQPYDISSVPENIERFVRAVFAKGYTHLGVFIDNSRNEKDTRDKWERRRLDDVRNGERKVATVPAGNRTFIASVFARLENPKVTVHLSEEMDNDTTLAAFAQIDSADVISKDKDFFRYQGRTYMVFEDFYLKGGKLQLVDHRLHSKSDREVADELQRWEKSPLKLPEQKPRTTSPAENAGQIRGLLLQAKPIYVAGCPSPLVRERGNPFITAAPLRRLVYEKLLVPHRRLFKVITERFPVWDKQRSVACFQNTEVFLDQPVANPSLHQRLLRCVESNDVLGVFAALFPEEAYRLSRETVLEWRLGRHVFGCLSVTIGLLAELDNTRDFYFYTELIQQCRPSIEKKSSNAWCKLRRPGEQEPHQSSNSGRGSDAPSWRR